MARSREKTTFPLNLSQEKFEQNVRDVKEYIAAGDAFQVVISQRFQRRTSAQPFTIYRALRALNPSPYMLKRQRWIKKQMRQLGGASYLDEL